MGLFKYRRYKPTPNCEITLFQSYNPNYYRSQSFHPPMFQTAHISPKYTNATANNPPHALVETERGQTETFYLWDGYASYWWSNFEECRN